MNYSNKGYTLIEVLVALAVFGILIIPVSKMINSVISLNKRAYNNTEIASLMNKAVEDAIKSNFSCTDNTFGNYKIEYIVDTTYKQNSIEGIKNEDKNDIDITINGDMLRINKSSNASLFLVNQILDNTKQNKLNIRITEDAVGNINYTINGTLSAPVNQNIKIDKSLNKINYGIRFDGGNSNKNIFIIIDGIYDTSGNIVNKALSVNYCNLAPTTSMISVSPMIVQNPNNNTALDDKENIVKLSITIKDASSGEELRKQTYYYTQRLK